MAIAFLLQGALGGALLLILVFVAVVAVVVVAGALGGALGNQSGAGDGEASQPGLLPPGTILAGVGMAMAVIGAFFPSLSFGFVGMALGAMAYYRGARVLGGVVSVLSFITLFVGYYMGGEIYRF